LIRLGQFLGEGGCDPGSFHAGVVASGWFC
jgi:hypothetical protein